jgi:hypothetical protein
MKKKALRLAAQRMVDEAAMEEMLQVAKELRAADPNSKLAAVLEQRVATEKRLRALVAHIKNRLR